MTRSPRWAAAVLGVAVLFCAACTADGGASETTTTPPGGGSATSDAATAQMAVTTEGVVTGRLLSPESYAAMTSKALIGRTRAIDGCTTCAPMTSGYTYGLGLISTGNWLIQNPLFAGQGGAFAYLPSERLAISVAVTFRPEAFGATSGFLEKGNSADFLWRRIATALVPSEAPEIPPGQG